MMNKQQTAPTVEEVLSDPTVHTWVKDSLRSALTKDVVDVARDAELLAAVLGRRCDEALGLAEVA